MDIKELVEGLKQKGLKDDEIKAELAKIKADIDQFLNPPKPGEASPTNEGQKPEENKAENENAESEADKENRIFGAI